MKYARLLLTASCLAAAIAVPAGRAQISITMDSLTYSENFNHAYTTSETATSLPWTNNATIPGWYLYMNAAGTPDSVTTQATLNGSSAGPIYLISHNSAATNFALTARVSDVNGSAPATAGAGYYFGLALTNNTSGTITEFALSYTGLQFYRSTGANYNTVNPAFQVVTGSAVSGMDFVNGTWNDLSSMVFTAPQNSSNGSASVLNFNTGSHVDFSPLTISDISWAVGDTLLLRWYIPNVAGVDQGVGIDNVSFTATAPIVAPIPEPTTTALLSGAVVLAGALAWRRRRLLS